MANRVKRTIPRTVTEPIAAATALLFDPFSALSVSSQAIDRLFCHVAVALLYIASWVWLWGRSRYFRSRYPIFSGLTGPTTPESALHTPVYLVVCPTLLLSPPAPSRSLPFPFSPKTLRSFTGRRRSFCCPGYFCFYFLYISFRFSMQQ